MTPLLGKDFVLYTVEGGVNKPVVCATEITITVEQEVKEATKPTATRWRSVYVGGVQYSISCNGLQVIDETATTGTDLMNKIRTGASVQWVAQGGGSKVYSGSIVPASATITAPAEGFSTFSFTAQGDGELVIT